MTKNIFAQELNY